MAVVGVVNISNIVTSVVLQTTLFVGSAILKGMESALEMALLSCVANSSTFDYEYLM